MKWKLMSVGLLVLLLVLSLWSERQAHGLICNQLLVEVEDSLQLRFLTSMRMESYILDHMLDPRGTPIEEVNTAEMEQMICQHPSVSAAQVYTDCRGRLMVKVKQRIPFFRIIATSGQSCYVDRSGLCMALSDHYTARTPVVNGKLSLPSRPDLRLERPLDPLQLLLNDSLARRARGTVEVMDPWMQFWDRFYEFMLYVDRDPFWRAQFTQIWIEGQDAIELVPRVGGHRILLGSLDNYEYKLNKLWSLYRAALPAPGLNAYSLLDLRFGNQVVCRRN